ncbi:hypothetical protein STCU_01279 [Strigomonas culicis]|uniref:Uncharacterized protein n=1 Tax=Strigomonas culicis TaxID=28005 RepID=S9UVW0_9TRYP|nr:hypothetical protein STCU_01279 [Strigomonas culicis]|eukprot:EPY35042.1 hypothetical protein STCU_01279 [Strigomonas culicis]
MSFRYTNNLIGALKHRLLLESASRTIAKSTYTGVCNGVHVTCSGYGTVLAVRLLDRPTWEPFYRAALSPPAAEAAPAPTAGLDLAKLSTSIKAALWAAQQQLDAAKEEAHQLALRRNRALLAAGELRHWYEEDGTTLHPRRCHSLKQEMATPYIQALRLGKTHHEALAAAARPRPAAAGRTRVVTEDADCAPAAISIGATHPLWAAGLIRLEDGGDDAAAASASGRVNANLVLVEQKQEMARDEERFWDRVELIRRAQLATIPGGVKRPYADADNATVKEEVGEKIVLRFTQ